MNVFDADALNWKLGGHHRPMPSLRLPAVVFLYVIDYYFNLRNELIVSDIEQSLISMMMLIFTGPPELF